MLRYVSFILLLIMNWTVAFSQTFNGTGGPIPDDGNSVDFTITVTGLPTSIDTTAFGLENACINITHTWDSDLNIRLIAPDGTAIMLSNGLGGDGDNFTNSCFTNDATQSIVQGSPPFTGSWRPVGQIGMVNNGQNPNGTWTLHILDTYPFADVGSVLNWNITFGNNPSSYFDLVSSNLPLVLINTSGQQILQDPKITAYMKIIDNGPVLRNYMTDSANGYSGYIGIDIRGHSSAGFPQKQFGLETRDSAGNNLNTVILGMPPDNDWVLYGAYNDKSLMRNALTYSLANDMGRYAPRGRYCEVVLNGEYIGVYTFFEKIKRDNNRVNIAGLTTSDSTGNAVTGGYICSIDWVDNDGWTSNYPPDPTDPQTNTVFYQYIYPKDTAMLPSQKTYIQQFVDSFETALLSTDFMNPVTGWRNYADEGSFIDYFIMNELSKNVDGYRLSTFFYKEKITDGGKINMGPLWDFNLAWHNADYCNNPNYGGWAYKLTDYCAWDFPFWWRRLEEDTLFQNNLRCRWDNLRTNILDTTYIFNYMDSIATIIDEGQARHYYIYPVLGTYLWPNPSPLALTYQEELSNLKTWIIQRMQFIDGSLPGICLTSGIAESDVNNDELFIGPNPATDFVKVKWEGSGVADVMITDVTGKEILTRHEIASGTIPLDISNLNKGVYVVRLLKNNKTMKSVKLVKL